MRMRCILPAAALLIFGLGAGANAAPLDIDVNIVRANWTNVVTTHGGVDFVDSDGLAGNEEIRWGAPAPPSHDQSGYRFDSGMPPTHHATLGVDFPLGTFTHFNFPIMTTSTSLISAQLDIVANLTIDGSSLDHGPFTFSFLHNETPNSSGGPASNDIVSFTNLATSDSFTIDGQLLTLALLGFRQGGITMEEFSTVEGRTNVAELIGVFRAPTNPVPEPGTIFLLGSGLAGLLGIFRRRSLR